jgi:hypothetical protein
MANFTVRVELLDARDEDYENLHKFMAAEGFTRAIKFGDVVYKLPPAEYSKIEDYTVDDVLQSAKRAAAKTGKRHRILVTKSTESGGFYNLEKA